MAQISIVLRSVLKEKREMRYLIQLHIPSYMVWTYFLRFQIVEGRNDRLYLGIKKH